MEYTLGNTCASTEEQPSSWTTMESGRFPSNESKTNGSQGGHRSRRETANGAISIVYAAGSEFFLVRISGRNPGRSYCWAIGLRT